MATERNWFDVNLGMFISAVRLNLGNVARVHVRTYRRSTCRTERRGKEVKVKLSLCLTKHHAMKTCGRVEV